MDETKNVNDMSTSGSETEQRENYGQPHFAYFQNSRCEYFPCHKLPENGFFNCLFCYCPLYALGDKCGGNFKFIAGGVKDCSAVIEGDGAWSRLKFESGVHRVQRVPETETQGRIHTSTATVAVLPEAEELDFYIDPKDLQIDTYRSSGAGGQHVNKTESAIRITHLPTGTVVECQDERSQYKNKDRAMKILRSKLYEAQQEKQNAAIAAQRKSQVGTGDRSGKIRTYNFPQNRVTDHRLTGDVKNFNIAAVINGDLDPLVDALTLADQARRLQEGAEKGE